MNMGNVKKDQGLYEEARVLLEQAQAVARQCGSDLSVADSLLNLGVLHIHQKDYEIASAYILEALPIAVGINARGMVAILYHNLGYTEHLRNEREKARVYYEKALAIRRELVW